MSVGYPSYEGFLAVKLLDCVEEFSHNIVSNLWRKQRVEVWGDAAAAIADNNNDDEADAAFVSNASYNLEGDRRLETENIKQQRGRGRRRIVFKAHDDREGQLANRSNAVNPWSPLVEVDEQPYWPCQ